jgi:O-methyltransferase
MKEATQELLIRLAVRQNLFLASAPHHGGTQIDPQAFGRGQWSQSSDYVRHGTLQLLLHELDQANVPGALAELGVFQGQFAAAMNRLAPTRNLYLFDTFSGFDQRDVESEQSRWVCSRVDIPHDGTSVDFVMSQMSTPRMVEPVVGWFPESAAGISEDLRFALVSLDADLYEPMAAGLEWFFDRLSPGGFLMVHDYNNSQFPGVRRAVEEFSSARALWSAPIPDSGGTAIIGRPR